MKSARILVDTSSDFAAVTFSSREQAAPGLGAGSELVVLAFEHDVERGERSGSRCANRNSWIVNRSGRCLRTRRTQKQRDVASVFRFGLRVSSPSRRVNLFRLKHFMA